MTARVAAPPVTARVEGDVLLIVAVPRTAVATITDDSAVWDADARGWRCAARHLPALREWCARAGRGLEVVEKVGP